MKKIILFLVLIIGIFLRLYKLDLIPPGVNPDEASTGYNAYSLLKTGKDRYGEEFPIAFRSLGTYILPLYTYLTVIPTAFFGPTIFSVRFISAFSSILLLFVTTLLSFEIKKITVTTRVLIVLFLSISPWAVNFGRGGHEISLSSTLFITSIFLFIKSVSNPKWIIPTLLLAGISASTYYTERYLILITLPLLIWMFKDHFIHHKKYLLIGLAIFVISQLPQLTLIKSDAFSRRIEQVNYLNDQPFNNNLLNLNNSALDRAIFILGEFTSHYLEYFSPRSLFFDPDPQNARSIPDISVFYSWMVIPFFFGIKFLLQNRSDPKIKILILLLIVGTIPAALTKDPFYSLRGLSFLWVLTAVIAVGTGYLINSITIKLISIGLIILLVVISCVSLYNSYFILLKHERSDNYGYEYGELINRLKSYYDKKVVIDDGRTPGVHVWIPFYGKLDPRKFQLQIDDQIRNNYYNNIDLDKETKIDNLEIRSINWINDIYEDGILVGDPLAISIEQAKEHKLDFLFEIKGLNGQIKLIAYTTNPKVKCEEGLRKGLYNPKCLDFK